MFFGWLLMSEHIDRITRILEMFLEEIKDIKRRLAALEKKVDVLRLVLILWSPPWELRKNVLI